MKQNKDLKKTAVFGGSFDPPHRGHIAVVKKLSKKFGRVIVVPSFISPFKQDAEAAGGEERIKMLKAAVGDIENVIISDYEVNKEGISYSADTVEHFAKEYGGEIVFVIGTDLLDRLSEWHDFDRLCSMCSFFVVRREGYETGEYDPVAEQLRSEGAELTFSKFRIKNYSSTLGRISVGFGKSDVTGRAVSKVAREDGLYTRYKYIVDAYKTFKMKRERINHTYRTVKAALALAVRYGEDIGKTVTAAMLHDIGKYADEKLLAKCGVYVEDEVYALPEPVRHAPIGARIAEQYVGIENDDIISAIELHTTGAKNMSRLAKIIFIADYIEEGRDFENIDIIRGKAEISLDLCLVAVLENTIEFLRKEGKEICPKTVEALEYYRGGEKKKRPAKRSGTPSYELAYTMAQYLDDKKARNIALIGLAEKTIIADYFVIATVGSTTAVKAMTDFIDEKLSKEHGIEPLRRDIDSKWAAIDYGSVILHIQCEDTRKFYDLERLWSDGTNIEYFGTED